MFAHADLRAVPAADDRLLNHLLRRALRHQFPLMQQQNPVCPQRREVQVVQYDADVQPAAAGQAFEQTQQMLLIIEIQRRGRLIEKQPALGRAIAPQLRQTAGQLHPLLFAAGEGGVASPGQMIAAGLLHHPADYLLVWRAAPRRAAHGDNRFDRPVGVQLGALQHHRPAAGKRFC